MVEKDNPDDAIAMRIMNMLDKEHGETLGVIKNRFRKEKGEKIENILAALEEMGKIKKLETTHQGNGKKIDKWFSV
jgi:DNA-binding TFAR19-related protein (PDSD5 family)